MDYLILFYESVRAIVMVLFAKFSIFSFFRAISYNFSEFFAFNNFGNPIIKFSSNSKPIYI